MSIFLRCFLCTRWRLSIFLYNFLLCYLNIYFYFAPIRWLLILKLLTKTLLKTLSLWLSMCPFTPLDALKMRRNTFITSGFRCDFSGSQAAFWMHLQDKKSPLWGLWSWLLKRLPSNDILFGENIFFLQNLFRWPPSNFLEVCIKILAINW
jgi:hypothetical protein